MHLVELGRDALTLTCPFFDGPSMQNNDIVDGELHKQIKFFQSQFPAQKGKPASPYRCQIAVHSRCNDANNNGTHTEREARSGNNSHSVVMGLESPVVVSLVSRSVYVHSLSDEFYGSHGLQTCPPTLAQSMAVSKSISSSSLKTVGHSQSIIRATYGLSSPLPLFTCSLYSS